MVTEALGVAMTTFSAQNFGARNYDRMRRGYHTSDVYKRQALNEVFYFGGEVDESFWEDLEDTLVMGDMGGEIACLLYTSRCV